MNFVFDLKYCYLADMLYYFIVMTLIFGQTCWVSDVDSEKQFSLCTNKGSEQLRGMQLISAFVFAT